MKRRTGTSERPISPVVSAGDAVLGLVVAALAVVTATLGPRTPGYRHTDAAALALAVAAGAIVSWRRRAPLTMLVLASGVVVVNAAAGYPVGAVQYAAWIGLYTVFAATADRRRRVAAAGLVVVAIGLYLLLDRGTPTADVGVGIALSAVVAALGGDLVRTRRALAEAERARGLARAEQEAAAREQTVLQERNRLARELHDALGHAVNVMVMQAGVGRHVFDERPDFARDALGHIENVGRDALVELDAVLRVLRPDDDVVADRSIPSLDGIETLCERIRATGRTVDVDIAPVSLSPSGERAAYRIVQEAVTNAARHSPSGTIHVCVGRRGPDAVITVRNPTAPGSAPPAQGRGLVNMSERARLEGGTLTCGPNGPDFVVQATLPLHLAERP